MPPSFRNPFTPGAGHPPPYLAGRKDEESEFRRLLEQEVILENLVLTGLRGVGKTVLLDSFRPLALRAGWRWSSADLSRSASVSEDRLAQRVLADLALITSSVVVSEKEQRTIGFAATKATRKQTLDFTLLEAIYKKTPGLASDKLKAVLELAWKCLKLTDGGTSGIIFAYDEAQNLTDRHDDDEYPLSLLLDVFQSIQKKKIPFMLVLAGLPTLFPNLVEARTYAERMFRIVQLDRLDAEACRDAIQKPIQHAGCPIKLEADAVETIVRLSGGYPYFIQFICREVYDSFLQGSGDGGSRPVPVEAILRKLDADFFEARWARLTERQRHLLWVIAHVEGSEAEFTVQALVEASATLLRKPFSPSHVNQMLLLLAKSGQVYKNRHGRYSLAVPLLGQFVKRQTVEEPEE